MAQERNHKGRDLEKAVELIQRTILRSDPQIKGTEFTIECNKVISVLGVRHEIDVFVKTLAGARYEATWIFECKNLKEPVSKNDVIILEEKVRSLGASRGFLVAKKFSKDAKAQAKQNVRIQLIECTEDFVAPFASLELIHSITDMQLMEVGIKQRGIACLENPTVLEWKRKQFRLNKTCVDFLPFLDSHAREMIATHATEKSAELKHEGTHPGQKSMQLVFDPGEFMMDDADVEHLVLTIRFTVTIRKPKLVSKSELKGQGRAYSFELGDYGPTGQKLEIGIVQVL